MALELKYIELKSGYENNGPAWIGRVKISRTGKTVYFNDHAFQKYNGISGNYYDVESGEEYWISGIKKNGTDRHWTGCGKIIIDRKIISSYLSIIGKEKLDDTKFIIEDIIDSFPVERIANLLNVKK